MANKQTRNQTKHPEKNPKRARKHAASADGKPHRLKIMAGTHRHRHIDFLAVDNDLRPTGARLRETLFNWLQAQLYDSHCVDLFAGSGILGFEALSRGAQSVTFVEKQGGVCQQLSANLAKLGIDNAQVIHGNALKTLESLTSADIIFLDPPYRLRLLPDLLDAVKVLTPKWLFIEDERPFEAWISARGDYRIHKSKKAGNIYYGLLQPIVK